MAESDYKIEFTHNEGHLTAFVTGNKMTVDIAKRYWQDIDRERERTGAINILIEDQVEGRINFTEYHEVGLAIAEMGFRGCRVAYVDKNMGLERTVLNSVLHTQTVLTNRGMTGKAFDNVEAARKWLLEA